MSYTKTTWKSGDKITSALLNNIETGIETVASDVATLSASVTNATNELTAAKALIQTNKETIEQNAADIAANVQRIQDQADAAAAHITAAEEAVANLNNGLDEIATIKTDLTTAAGVANDAKAKADANETAISSLQDSVTALQGVDGITKNRLSGLIAVDGVNVTNARHVVVTKKNDNTTCEAIIWNEASGGGVQVKDIENDMVSFIGANRGYVDQGIYSQFYAKKISTNVGCRVNFTDTGAYMTLNKSNGSYTDGDLLMTKTMINDLLAPYIERIATLESEVATLKANGATLSE